MSVVLVLSASQDHEACDLVAHHLAAHGLELVRFYADEVARSRTAFQIEVAHGTATLRIAGRRVREDDIAAGWWRKPQWLGLSQADAAERASLAAEHRLLHQNLASLLPPSRTINGMNLGGRGGLRLRQLQLAHRHGFDVPSTTVTNDWEHVNAKLANAPELIFKSFTGSLNSTSGSRVVFTNALDGDAIATLSQRATPYPGFFQPRVPKRREWRVTVVGDAVFAAAVRVASDRPIAEVDWRRGQLSGDVEFTAEPLASGVEDQVRTLVRDLDLDYAGVDLIETHDGRLVFLEANPNGQYLWLERQLGFPISEAIAHLLAEKAQQVDPGAQSKRHDAENDR